MAACAAMPAPLPLILLPPSEGKAAGGDGPAWSHDTMQVDLDRERDKVLAGLARAMRQNEAARGKLLGVKGVALAAATEANRSVRSSPTLPAIERYTGVLYDAMDVSTLSRASRSRVDRSVLIVSALWGVVAPADLIPDYKLKMGAALPALGRTTSFWRSPLSERISQEAHGRTVWNLLPNEHAAAWVAPSGTEQFTVKFLERRADGSLVAVSHWNKLLKGALVRFLADHPGTTGRDLADWQHPLGYRLEPTRADEHGDLTVLTFVQDSA